MRARVGLICDRRFVEGQTASLVLEPYIAADDILGAIWSAFAEALKR